MEKHCDACDESPMFAEWEGQYLCFRCWEYAVSTEMGSDSGHCDECWQRHSLPKWGQHSLCPECFDMFVIEGRKLSDYNEAIWKLVNGL
jgi:hypothetical protein